MHTDGVFEAKLTLGPDVTVADTENGGSPKVLSLKAPKLMYGVAAVVNVTT